MAINSDDLVAALLNDQARVNSAVDDADINNLVADVQIITGERVGLNATETITVVSEGVTPHKWDDGQSFWGFAQWT